MIVMNVTKIHAERLIQPPGCGRGFGGHSWCGYWSRLRSVGRLLAAWGVRFPCPPQDRPTKLALENREHPSGVL